VNQITVFDGKGQIYADRLCFVNRHDYDSARIDIHGIEPQYEPFAPVTLNLKLQDIQDTATSVSLAVRDRATEEQTYDNGTMLTEMMLASEIKGFVENPGYYFEADDSMHRRDLDLLLMVQGWRRYEWKEMAGIETFALQHLPERQQNLTGSVNLTYNLYPDNEPGEDAWITPLMQENKDLTVPVEFYTTEKCNWKYRNKDLQDLYGSLIKKLDKEMNIFASFAQGNQSLNLMQKTTNGHFHMITPKFYEACIVDLTGTTNGGKAAGFTEQYKKGYDDEEQYPNYYVKLDPFYPKFTQPYGFYQDLIFNKTDPGYTPQDSSTFFNRRLPVVNISNKRNGLRKLDLDKPAVVMDAYEAFNLISDYGLNGGKHDWRTFSRQLAFATVGDMGLDRRYFIQEQYDGKPLNLKINQGTDYRKALKKHKWDVQIEVPTAPDYSNSKEIMKKYRLLRYLDKIYIYTDYAPREQGSWKYAQDNQPEVIIDYRLFPNDGYQRTYRDRHYVLRGYAVCKDFYSPDYSRKPLPDTKDYRRTLLWIPEVKFDEKGEATVRLFNNSKQTVISVEAEGITGKGRPIVYKK
jgi:hypothetical protein